MTHVLSGINDSIKEDTDDASVPSAPLTYLELFSRARSRNKTNWLIPPVHHWYQGSRPGGAQAHGPDIALLIFGDHQQHDSHCFHFSVETSDL
ncbi:hypothetical protein AVEN_114085-1 [Araneus ventricosus]|uniref:Uncharacterized protein n=1 Tax=Araneus ventricosus TaxID=182803 RepID=A0A4Y2U9Z7_ARAVE|nr:hypothetical protein AVEN_114085-1 [Araneus ventricosus]